MFVAQRRGQATRTQRRLSASGDFRHALRAGVSNLDFGRSWRRTLAQAGHVRVIAGGKDACHPKRYDETRCLHCVCRETASRTSP